MVHVEVFTVVGKMTFGSSKIGSRISRHISLISIKGGLLGGLVGGVKGVSS
jgi:hypothetical protein